MRSNGGGGSGSKPASVFGKLILTAFLSVFVFVGIFFAGMVLDGVRDGIDRRGWVERPCVVLDSGVHIDSSSNEPYTPWVDYRYEHGGTTYRGSAVSDGDPSTSNYREAQAVSLAYPPDGQGTCWVDPDNPSQSVLDTGGLAWVGMLAFFVVWLSLFSGIPLLIIIGAWWPKKKKLDDTITSKRRSTRKQAKYGWIGGVVFGGVFAAVGLGLLIFMTILPLWRAAMAQAWDEVDCVVERSALLRFEDDDGATYRIDILYRYDIDGQRYGSNRHDFASFGSSSGRVGKQKIVSAHPLGFKTTCYVDPGDPTSAVLKRGLTGASWWGLFPLPFLAAGLFVMVASVRGRHGDRSNTWRPKRKQKAPSDRPTPGATGADPGTPITDDGPVTLRPRGSRIGKFFGLLVFAAIWNGIVSVFVTIAVKSWINGDPDICISLFVIPFVLIGLVVFLAAIQHFLLIFAPRIVIELGRRTIPLGGSTKLRWSVDGRAGSLHHVRITLVGEEQATYTRGTDTVTDKHVFYEQPLVGAEAQRSDFDTLPMLEDRGELVLTIPADTMHSFAGKNNKILWKLRVVAEVKRWPDPKDQYTITVAPAPITGP